VRYANHRAVPRYCSEIEAGDLPVASHEVLTARQMLGERLFLGLRTADGIPDAWLEERLALGPASLARRLDDWVERGLLQRADARARLTEAGFLLSDALFAELL
jgi:oxygen-independent coproporphyrinogen-3 oxidase